MAKRNFIFDFDSTIVQEESLDALLHHVLQNKQGSEKLANELSRLTELSMDGQLSFHESLKQRVYAATLFKEDIDAVAQSLKNKISPAFLRHESFIKTHCDQIYIVSGGFFELIWPVAQRLGIKAENIYANRFLYDHNGKVIDFDQSRPTALDQGKVIQVQQLNLDGDVIVIGDGYTDYEIKAAGLAHSFFAYTETVERPHVIEVADGVFSDLEGIFFVLNITVQAPPASKKALLLENIHPVAIDYLKSQGYEIKTLPRALLENADESLLEDIDLLGIRSKTQLTQAWLDKAPNLACIGAFCIGTNQIDLKACSERGIAVFNAPFSNTRSVVEMAMAQIIILFRNLSDKNIQMHEGQWVKSAKNSYEIRGKTLGIVGYGNIGAQLSVLAENCGMHVIYYDLEEKLPLGNAKSCENLHACLKQADVVSLHVDGRPENRHFINEKALKDMKAGSYLINLSRGEVVDLNALEKALQTKHLFGAAIDVFPEEPEANKAAFIHPLQKCPNVILTPHVGGSTQEAQENIGRFVSHKLHEYTRLGSTLNSLNLPGLQLPAIQASHRIIHIHENVPGILAKINSFFGEHEVNIEAQYLKTNETIGYVITDVNVLNGHGFLESLEKIPHTIKVRVLY